MSVENVDVAIVGGGVMGCAAAYFLAAEMKFDGRILIIERDPSYANCATTRSWGGVRQQFSTPENIQMSLFGAEFVASAHERLEVDGDKPDLAFRQQGYLFLASAHGWPILQANCVLQRELGAQTELLSKERLSNRFPWLNLDGIVGAGWGPVNEGWLDPNALLQSLRRKAKQNGVRYLHDPVSSIERSNGSIRTVCLESGARIACGLLVNAAGPKAGCVAALAGIDLPVRPRKRMSYVFDCRQDLSHAPLTIDPSGVAFRPEGGHYIAIVSPPAEQDPDSNDLELDYHWFEEVIWPSLAERVPAFQAIKLIRAWAGHYDYNTFDQNAILGPHPEIGNFYFCNGFSGHGIQQAPAAGRAIAELIVSGRFLTLDLSRFGYERIAKGEPLREVNVV